MINYKSLSLFLLFVLCAWLGLNIEHDSYQLCFGIASAILAVAVVHCFMNNRLAMLLFCAFLAVLFCQFSVTARKAIKDPEFRQRFNYENTTGVLFGDVIHGFIRTVGICKNELPDGIVEVKNNGTYATLERIKFRYLSLVCSYMVICVPSIIKKEPNPSVKKKKK